MSLLLTIGVPTYNRADRLLRCLSRIAIEVRKVEFGLVEVLVSDNHSLDHTQKVIDEFLTANSDLSFRSIRQDSNLGMDGNFSYLLHNAYSPHVILLSDDDYLIEGRIVEIVRILAGLTPRSVICVDHPGQSKRANWGLDAYNGDVSIKIADADQALEFMGSGLFFLTSTIFPTALVPDFSLPGRGSLIQLAYYFSYALRNADWIGLDCRKVVEHSGNGRVSYDLPQVLVTNYFNYLDWLQSIGYSRAVVERLTANHFGKFIYGGIIYRKSQWQILGSDYTYSEMNSFVEHLNRLPPRVIGWRCLLIMKAICMMPIWLFRAISFCKSFFKVFYVEITKIYKAKV